MSLTDALRFITTLALHPPSLKGGLGEMQVNFISWLHLDRKAYRRISNVTLQFPDGTTQIDHIIVSPYGIFVIETKNMKGWIFGGEHQTTWTQKLFKKTHRFQNPLHQNFRHIRALSQLLDLPETCFQSIVVFIGKAEFKTPMPANVTRWSGFVGYIKQHTQICFTDEQISDITESIESLRLKPGLVTHVAHVQSLAARHHPIPNANSQLACPRCGAPMVKRTARRGTNQGNSFWGCSSYPKCRGVR